MNTYREQLSRGGSNRTRWIVLGAALVAIAVVITLVIVYSGGGSGGGY